jgi:hypothetical protein
MNPYGIDGGYGTNVKLVGPIVDGHTSVKFLKNIYLEKYNTIFSWPNICAFLSSEVL